jgi:hypothetical protein
MAINSGIPTVMSGADTRRRILSDPGFFDVCALVCQPVVGSEVVVAISWSNLAMLCNLGTLTSVTISDRYEGLTCYTIVTSLTQEMFDASQMQSAEVSLPVAPRL